MTRTRWTAGAALAVLLIVGLAPLDVRAQKPAMLTVAWNTQRTALDPAEPSSFLTSPPAYEGAFLIYDGLVRFNDKMSIVPALATSWSVAADGRTWTFNIRRGVSFQDGAPLTAQSVVEALQRQLNPATNPSNRPLWDPVASAAAPDASTVRVVTKEPYGGLLHTLAHGSSLIGRPGAAGTPARPPAGTGPYTVDRWDPGKQLEVVRSAHYWEGRPEFDRIVLRGIADPAVRLAMIENGQAQVAEGIPPHRVSDVGKMRGIHVTITPGLRAFGMAINLNRPVLQDIRVRQALNYAVNKELIVNALFGGHAAVLRSPIASPASGYVDLGPWPYDPPRARRLLEDAGWKPAPPIGVRVRGTQSLQLTLLTPRGAFTRDVEVIETLADYLRNVGFEPHFVYVDPAGLWNSVLIAPDRYEWDLVLFGFDPANGDGGFHLDALYRSNPDRQHGPLIRNVTWYSNPHVDAWLSQGSRTLDPTTRAVSYAKVERQVWDDAPYLWLYAEDVIVATREVRGVEVLPSGLTVLRSAHP